MNKLVCALIAGFVATAANAAEPSMATQDVTAVGANTAHEASTADANAQHKQKKAAVAHHRANKKKEKEKKAAHAAEKKVGEESAKKTDANPAENPAVAAE